MNAPIDDIARLHHRLECWMFALGFLLGVIVTLLTLAFAFFRRALV